MLIFDENQKAILLDQIYNPILTDYFWVLDLNIMDFTVIPLLATEEIEDKSMELCINEFKFILPKSWHVMIVDPEVGLIDIIEIKKCAGKDFQAFIYGNNKKSYEHSSVLITDYYERYINVAPMLNRHQMLCHPIAPNSWICVSPYDVFKYIKNVLVGDLID